MPPEVRRALLAVSSFVVIGALIWASFFESLPRAEFSLQNGADPKTLDPARAEGNIESRLIFALFEGLLRMLPEGEPDPDSGLQPLSAQPGMAESYEVSEDGKTYTFHIREDAKWSDGSPVTSRDFMFSWQRMLHPEVLCQYTYQLFTLPYAQQYNEGTVDTGDKVEVELWDRPDDTATSGSDQPFPRGTIRYGVVEKIDKEPEPTFGELPTAPDTKQEEQKRRNKTLADWRHRWVYHVRIIEPDADNNVDWDASGETQKFCSNMESAVADDSTTRCHMVLVAFDKLGAIKAPNDQTFVVTLKNSTPYFPNVVAFYPLFPVQRECIEKHGSPLWTKPENIVTNGPFRLQFRLLRDRVRLMKNEHYFAADETGFETVDFMSVEKAPTAMNMYETNQIQWVTDPPAILREELLRRDDFYSAPQLTVYFYRFNVNVPPLNDARVRRAISMSIDRQEIVEEITRSGQIPAYTIVPPGLAGYKSAEGFRHDVTEAKRLLEEAGYASGRGIPKLTVLYNTNEAHRDIAEVIQQQLRNALNIPIALENMEWGTYIDNVNKQDYQIARAGWIADYPDPNTFLDMWITGGPQNNTGWSNEQYDALIQGAAEEGDPEKRMAMLRDAEQILVDEMPIAPIYFYTSLNVAKPNIENFFPTAQDLHPLHLMRYRDEPKAKE